MSEISLTPAIYEQVRELRTRDDELTRTQQRLTTARNVNSVLDDPARFFGSRDLNAVASNFEQAIDNTERALNLVQVTAEAAQTVEQLVQVVRDVVEAARRDPGLRAGAEESVRQVLSQVNQVIGDANFQGQNLLSATADRTISFRVGGSSSASLGIEARQLRATNPGRGALFTTAVFSALNTVTTTREALSGLGQVAPAARLDDPSFDDDAFSRLVSGLDRVVSRARQTANNFETTVTTLQVRAQFNRSVVQTNLEARDRLVAADLNEEGASLVTTQTRRELGISALRSQTRGIRSVVTLIRGVNER